MDHSTDFKQRLDKVTAALTAGRRAEAYDAAKHLVAGYPEAARAHNMLGILRAGENDGEGAVASFQSAVAFEPSFAEAHYNLGLALCKLGRFPAAEKCLRDALQLDPKNPAYYIVLGNALRQLGKPDEAVTAYERAREIGGVAEALILNNLGAVFLDMNSPEKAVALFRRVVDLQPDSSGAQINLGNSLLRLGRLEEALERFREAVKLDPRSANAALLFANALRDIGRFEEAVAAYKAVLRLRADDKQASYHLGLTLMQLGRLAEGLRAVADGPGIARISGAPPVAARYLSPGDRVEVAKHNSPNFIGAWRMSTPDLCDRLIAFFERNSSRHGAGRTGSGIDKTMKDSTDLTVLPCDVGKPGFEAVSDYLAHLEACYQDYIVQWPFLGEVLPQGEIVPFTIQRYESGGHFQRVHSERNSSTFAHRVFAWMTYLDDVEEGGETRFHHYGIDVRPERGKTLIWPAEWTHAHAGTVVRKGRKHIITGWIHFPIG